MRLTPLLLPALIVALNACSQFPELDHTVDSDARNAAYPDLVPVETLKSGIPETQIVPETEKDLESRIKRLKARSNRMRGAVVDDTTQERMSAGIKPVSE